MKQCNESPFRSKLLAGVAALGLMATPVLAHHVEGYVRCVDVDPNEPLAGITVTVDPTGTFAGGMDVTDASGYYYITLPSGLYTNFTIHISGYGDLTPTDPVGGTTQFTTTPTDNIKHIDFSLTGCDEPPPCATIGDLVWLDENCDGIQDQGEMGMAGIGVWLLNCEGEVIDSTETDVNGNYYFRCIDAGDYVIQVDLPEGYHFSPQNQGGNDEVDSDVDPTTGKTACITLEPGEEDLTVDAGLCPPSDGPGTGTIGYWKNHPEAWPVDEIEMGGVTYSKADAIAIMKTPIKGDKWLNMFNQLLAAKLNVMIGNDSSCVASEIEEADEWLGDTAGDRPISARSSLWKDELHNYLDDYNNGNLCAPHRD